MTAAQGREVGVAQRRSVRNEIVERLVRDAARAHCEHLGLQQLDVLDVGGGTGSVAVPLATGGHRVTVVDPSPDALAGLERRAADAGVSDRVRGVQGDVDGILQVVDSAGADLVLCHNVLEVLDDRDRALQAIAAATRPTGALSLIAANRHAVVWAKALAGQPEAALSALSDQSGRGRWVTFDELAALLERNGYRVADAHGVRIFTDLVPAGPERGHRTGESRSSSDSTNALLDLELAASGHPAFRGLGTHLHMLAHLG